MNTRTVVATLAAAALALPTAAVAQPGHGKGQDKQTQKANGKRHEHGKAKHPKKVTFVFKGTFTAPGTVKVTSGNSHVRTGGFVGHAVSFDFADAKVVAADTNGDEKVDLTDVKDGDVVLVQARVAKRTKHADDAEALAARKLVDKSNRPVEGDEAPAAS